jgi:hypothetical protein
MDVGVFPIWPWTISVRRRHCQSPSLNQNLINHKMTDIIYIAVSILAGGILILFTWSCSKI